MASTQVPPSLGGNLLDLMSSTCFKCYESYSFVNDIECVLFMLVDVVNDSFNTYLLSLKSNNWYQSQFQLVLKLLMFVQLFFSFSFFFWLFWAYGVYTHFSKIPY